MLNQGGVISSIQSYFILVVITHRHQCLIFVVGHSLPMNRHHPLSTSPHRK